MKYTLFLTMMAAALLGSGVANAAEPFYPKDYKGGSIVLGSTQTYDALVVEVPLTLTGTGGFLDLHDGATFAFSKENEAEAICSIHTSAERKSNTVYFNRPNSIFNITFDNGAQAIVASSAGTPITLIEDLNKESKGFKFAWDAVPSNTTLTLNGKGYNETVVLDGVSFTYVGPKESDYVFQTGEIGFTGYENGSHALNLVVGGGSVPEPTTGTLSLLALAGLCARRRRK